MKTSSELLGHAFTRALHRWRHTPVGKVDLPPSPVRLEAFTVAISRDAGCGGEAIAREIGTLLEWPVYDRELLEQMTAETRGRAADLEALDEKPPSWFVEVLQGLAGERNSARKYARELFRTIAILGDHGGAVIVGRGAVLMLSPERTLRVRLIAPGDVRAANVQKQRGISLPDARREIATIDEDRRKFVERSLHKDVDDLSHYDLVLNTARFTPEAAAEIVVQSLRQLFAGLTGETPTRAGAPSQEVASGFAAG